MKNEFTNLKRVEMIKKVIEGLDVENKDIMLEYLDKQINSLSKPRVRKSVVNEVNEEMKNIIVDTLVRADRAMKAKEIMEVAFEGYTYEEKGETKEVKIQKVSALMTQLVKEGRIVRAESEAIYSAIK